MVEKANITRVLAISSTALSAFHQLLEGFKALMWVGSSDWEYTSSWKGIKCNWYGGCHCSIQELSVLWGCPDLLLSCCRYQWAFERSSMLSALSSYLSTFHLQHGGEAECSANNQLRAKRGDSPFESCRQLQGTGLKWADNPCVGWSGGILLV